MLDWGEGKEIWNALWAIEVPNIVMLFFLRACNNFLPTKANIFYKKVVDNIKCPCCESDDETIIHALWECPAACDVCVWGGGGGGCLIFS
jgi:hypothetical protein